MMAKVFISYSRQDNTFAHRLVQDLRSTDQTVWMDVSTLRAGQDWADEIDRAVRAYDALILVVSPDSMKSEWVSKETILAMNLKKPIVPVMCRQTDLPVHLVDIQYIDFQDRYNEALPQLVQVLSALSATGPPPAEPPPPWPAPSKRKRRIWLLAGSLSCFFLLVVMAAAGTISWQMLATPTVVALKSTHTPPPTPTNKPSRDTIIPDLTETDTPEPAATDTSTPEPTATFTPLPTDTPTPTPLPTNALTPTPNPAFGTFQTEFEESTEIVQLAFGPTLGGQAICKYHNITLAQQDVGKTLTAYIRDWYIEAPDHYTDVIDLSLFRSQIGPWQAGQDGIDLWNSPQAEPILTGQDEINWTVTQLGDYIICLQAPVNTYYDPEVSFNWASFTVLLSGG